jgi:hypothetical protein
MDGEIKRKEQGQREKQIKYTPYGDYRVGTCKRK